jgi:hypothetical protein
VRYPATLLLALALTGCAGKQQFKTAQSLSGETSVTGCLNYDANSDQYVLTDRDGEKTYVVSEGAHLKLQADGNQTVRVIGIRQAGGKTLKAIQIIHVAGSCAVPF